MSMKKKVESKPEGVTSVASLSPVDNLPVDKLQESWIKLYPLIEHWQSDMKFFEEEARFLHLLIDKYFVELIKEKNIDKTRVLAKKLFSMEPQRKYLAEQIGTHLLHLQELMENSFSHDAHVFYNEHLEMEKSILRFMGDLRSLRSEVFKLIENVISEDTKHHVL